jgi:hypothetical protein
VAISPGFVLRPARWAGEPKRDLTPQGWGQTAGSARNITKKLQFGARMVYMSGMRMVPDRAVLTVGRHNGSWAVEFDGQLFGHSSDREVSKAAANKRARQIVDAGRACQVRVTGETGYFDGP